MSDSLFEFASDSAVIIIGGAVFLILLSFFCARYQRRVVKDGARKIKQQTDAVYSGPHEYAEVRLEDFPYLDHEFYDRAAAELQAEGYTPLGELEDVTVSRAFPKMRTCIRALVGDEGTTVAGIYHVQLRGFLRVFQWIGLVPRNLQVVELGSELAPGSFLSTATTLGVDGMTYPDELRMERLPLGTSVQDVLECHRRRLMDLLRETGEDPVRMRNLKDVIASKHRGMATLARHRQSVGTLTAEELEQIAQRPLNQTDKELLKELEHQSD